MSPHWSINTCLLVVLVVGAARGADDSPRIVHVGAVAPDILGITIETGRLIKGQQEPYAQQDGDVVEKMERFGNGYVRRGGNQIGALVGPKADVIGYFDRLEGAPLGTAWADKPDTYTISSRDDPVFAAGLKPLAVYRKSKPTDMAQAGGWAFQWPMVHVLYLKLPSPLTSGKSYAIAFAGGLLPGTTYPNRVETSRSEAVHVTQIGFRPDEPVKVAFLSCWLGSGGALSYAANTRFRVLDDKTGEVVHTGKILLSKAAGAKDEDPYNKNYNGTDVHLLDFWALKVPGTYRICVDGVGCSVPVEIAPDAWRKAFAVSAKSFYHQRSGIPLGPPYSTYRRPRCCHPEDGVTVATSSCSLMDSGNGLNAKGTDNDNFGNLVKGKTDDRVANAWGGYFDAGDWDRRIQHLDATRLLLELGELFPDFVGGVTLNLPESGNGLPDVLNEALWNIDFFRRLQTPTGGIRGGIESAEHPRLGEASWQESLPVMAYAPDPWCSYLYAADAARASALLQPLKFDVAQALLVSARKAMGWAEAEYAKGKDAKLPHHVRDARNLAAASLFAVTGEKRWNDLFLETTVFTDPGKTPSVWQSHDQRDAAFVYARTRRPGVSEDIRKNALNATLREANGSAELGAKTGFKWTKRDPWEPFNGGKASVPQAITLMRAFALTGDERYLCASLLAAQSGAGANPLNLCYTTGVGLNSPKHPLVVDAFVMGWAPPPGITVYGPNDFAGAPGYFTLKLLEPVMYPAPMKWPVMDFYVDIFLFPAVTEFTVMETLGPNAYVWGSLAARK
ncbi:MAG TPA: glycoside hydrolase family 9 protein [Verrucomicrobiae bacterium]|nr:glycoside hydrolase family 9 protein [Verrucomicrobiae bacterium]